MNREYEVNKRYPNKTALIEQVIYLWDKIARLTAERDADHYAGRSHGGGKRSMKRKTALKYAREIARRVHSVNGIVCTPNTNYTATKIRRIWVFGSTIKGAEYPNDLDILIDMRCDQRVPWKRGRKIDKRYHHSYGCHVLPCSRKETMKWLTKNMKNVSRHDLREERIPIDIMYLIYPRWDIPE